MSLCTQWRSLPGELFRMTRGFGTTSRRDLVPKWYKRIRITTLSVRTSVVPGCIAARLTYQMMRTIDMMQLLTDIWNIICSTAIETAVVYTFGLTAVVIWALRHPKKFDNIVQKLEERE